MGKYEVLIFFSHFLSLKSVGSVYVIVVAFFSYYLVIFLLLFSFCGLGQKMFESLLVSRKSVD